MPAMGRGRGVPVAVTKRHIMQHRAGPRSLPALCGADLYRDVYKYDAGLPIKRSALQVRRRDR